MRRISILENTIQKYAWGSYTAIPELLGKDPQQEEPCAELWMGAHIKSPSMVKYNGNQIPLPELINLYPGKILGKEVVKKFEKTLPYLFKVLAAAKPLSIQAHPNRIQAIKGFQRENRLNIPLNAPHRNYKDANHKPECICALTRFFALNGFRNISEMLLLSEKFSLKLENELAALKNNPTSQGLKIFFQTLMTLEPGQKEIIIKHSIDKAKQHLQDDPIAEWMLRLYQEYPTEIGVLSPIFLNLISLEPGQAMFLPSGQLHSYLDGVGIELMANSDNVLRGGLTPKHIDVEELLRVLHFEAGDINIMLPQKISDYESVYLTPAEEFLLSVISISKEMGGVSFLTNSVEILLCTQGKATFSDAAYTLEIIKGRSVIIPAAVREYQIKGEAIFYKASVPL